MENKNLIQSLILSDFIFLKIKKYQYLRHIKSVLFLKEKVAILNFLEIVKSLKQLIRLLQFLKTKKSCLSNLLYILIENTFYTTILSTFIKNKKLLNIKVFSSIRKKDLLVKKVQMLLNLTSNKTKYLNFFNQLVLNNIFLIQSINSKMELKQFGAYKIYNKLDDIKKFLFIVVLISQIYKN